MSREDVENPELCVAELMRLWPDTINVFLRRRMLCVGCMVSHFHTVADVCLAYDLDRDVFMAEVRAEIAAG
ncbi:MAG: DUF1858 domain-containing protein [Loktanella sp.]|nr:DUF1858 domain-containing protein [Loktanella sp.]